VFPDKLKDAVVIPIFKSGDRTLTSNYRPISLLSNVSKIIEKAIKGRMDDYLDSLDVLSPRQYGFRTKMGTQDAIGFLTESIVTALDEGDKCLAIFLDLAKAFDTVSHKILLRKLELMGIRGVALELFKSYLSGRSQVTRVGEVESTPKNIRYGVPQGSTLGPLLFILYINDLCNLGIEGEIIAFADDTALVFRGKAWQSVYERAERGISLVGRWLNDHLLTLNTDKTRFVPFSLTSSGQPDSLTIKIHYCSDQNSGSLCQCPNITGCTSIKYLGIIIDAHIRWDIHLAKLSNRLRKLIHVFRNLRNVLTDDCLRSVYCALFDSLLSYGIESWGGAPEVHMHPVIIVQKSVLRVMSRQPYRSPSEPIFQHYRVLDPRQVFVKNILSRYNCNSTDAITGSSSGTGGMMTRSTANNVRMLPSMNTALGQRSCRFLAPKMFNFLCTDFPELRYYCPTKRSFVNIVRRWLLSMGRETTRRKMIHILS
jgi:hypothetical protein